METNNEKIYLRVLNDLPFMWEIFRRCEQQADEFTVEMLQKRINIEREAFRLEQDRLQREAERITQERQQEIEQKRIGQDD